MYFFELFCDRIDVRLNFEVEFYWLRWDVVVVVRFCIVDVVEEVDL